MIEQLALITDRAVDLVDLSVAEKTILGQTLKYGQRFGCRICRSLYRGSERVLEKAFSLQY